MNLRVARTDAAMVLLLSEALVALVVYDIVMWRHGLSRMLSFVRNCTVAAPTASPEIIKRVCSAVETACVWYPRQALCLQRSAIMTCLMRRRGVPARLVIGTRVMPLLAHAWVEVNGVVINDWPRVQHAYTAIAQY